MSLPRLIASALLAGMLAGCSGPVPSPSATTPDPNASREAACLAAVAGVVAAVQAQVARYDTAQPTPAPTSTPAPDLDTALADAKRATEVNGCDPDAFARKLQADLNALKPSGPIAVAVRDRLTASITGQIPDKPVDRTVRVTESLAKVLATAPAGSVLRLEQGDHRTLQPLVLLDGVSLIGAGRDKTRILSGAPDVAVLDVTPAKVELRALSLVRDTGVPGSGIVTGPAAALVLADVTISGGRLSTSKQGGAAVHLSGQASDPAATGTTLQVDRSRFVNNAWAGIAVTGRHRVSVVASAFADNRECGLCFMDGSEGSVSRSRFTGNRVGIAALGSSRPQVIDNTLSGGEVGIQADAKAVPALRDNRVTSAAKAAVIYGGTSGGTIQGTTCPGVKFGIVVGTKAAPTLLANACPLARGA